MALHVPKAPGFASMLKDGARHYSGLEEAVIRLFTHFFVLANILIKERQLLDIWFG